MASSIHTFTHDTSSAGFHIPDFTSFLSHLTDAVSAAWPDKFATRYTKVTVLLMSWDKDDLELEHEIRQLESVFRGLYHYDTEYWKIPSKRTVVELSRKVADLGDIHGQEGSLLIVYYGGHARLSDQSGGSPVWAANRTRDSATVQSSIVHSLLEELDCDVLLLNDCFQPTTTRATYTGKGMIETLAASSLEAALTKGENYSFTAALVQELAHAVHTTDWLSIVELHRRLINRLQAWTTSVSLTDDAYSLVQVDRRTGQPVFERPRRKTPVYACLSEKPRTIVLTPLTPQTAQQLDQAFLQLTLPTVQPQITPNGPGILVTCRLRDQRVDVWKWKQWLSDAPEAAKGIQISALYPGFSTTLVVELPLVVWDLLPPSPAITFVAYTTGDNHISDFRRALLGFDPEEQAETEEGGSDEEQERKGSKRSKDLSHKSRKNAHTPLLWLKVFNSDRPAAYAAEGEAYCTSLAELHAEERGTKAERIIQVFVQDHSNPSTSYIRDEIENFCSQESLEEPGNVQEAATEVVAILDERFPKHPNSPRSGTQFLSKGELFETLTTTPSPQLIDPDSKFDLMAPKRRLLRSQTFLHEAQISIMIAGLDNNHWTAYGFFDTYNDGRESKLDVRSYQTTQGEPLRDPLTCGQHPFEEPVYDAREYFLRAMEACLILGLSETISAWDNFQEISLPYFNLADPKTTTKLRNISNDIQSLRTLEATLSKQKETLKSFTLRSGQ
ncbi:hypothetical protein N0V88_007797 [Collariella sp. IMI 366227]|nr:hypothetical protein N0V88_007797 [Collariella sp. IMI 366227]